MTQPLTQVPQTPSRTFLNFPLTLDLDHLQADIAILGIPYGLPYRPHEMANDQSRAPDAIRQAPNYVPYTLSSYDWDLDGYLLDGRDITVVDCGNVSAELNAVHPLPPEALHGGQGGGERSRHYGPFGSGPVNALGGMLDGINHLLQRNPLFPDRLGERVNRESVRCISRVGPGGA